MKLLRKSTCRPSMDHSAGRAEQISLRKVPVALQASQIWPSTSCVLIMGGWEQVRPGGLAAFPVEVVAPEDNDEGDEEGLVVMVEVPKDKQPKPDNVKELVGFIRAQVRSLPLPPACRTTAGPVARGSLWVHEAGPMKCILQHELGTQPR